MTRVGIVQTLQKLDYHRDQANMVIGDILRIISEALVNGEKVSIRGFGTFEVKSRKGHPVKNPRTGEDASIEDYKVVTFKAGDNLKDAIKTGDVGKLVCLVREDD